MNRKRTQRGFTLVELMVVVTIIGILAAIAIPRVFVYIRTSATAEVSSQASTIASAISGYTQSQLKTAAALKTELNGKTVTPDLSTGTELSAIIPQVVLPKDGNFNYKVAATVATAGPLTGELVYCITATGRATAAVSGGLLLYSAAASKAAGWDGHINRLPFVKGNTTLTGITAGGYCSTAGAVTATCATC